MKSYNILNTEHSPTKKDYKGIKIKVSLSSIIKLVKRYINNSKRYKK